MILFLEACADYGVLSIVYFVKKMLELVFIILPIILIVMILMDFTKNVMAKGDDDIKKNNRVVIIRIVYSIIAFFVPTIVNVVIYDFLMAISYTHAGVQSIQKPQKPMFFQGLFVFL